MAQKRNGNLKIMKKKANARVGVQPKHKCVQTHHITYEPERTVNIYKGEHWILTRMQWMKYVSKGFLTALRQFIKDNSGIAVALRKPRKKRTTRRKKRKTKR